LTGTRPDSRAVTRCIAVERNIDAAANQVRKRKLFIFPGLHLISSELVAEDTIVPLPGPENVVTGWIHNQGQGRGQLFVPRAVIVDYPVTDAFAAEDELFAVVIERAFFEQVAPAVVTEQLYLLAGFQINSPDTVFAVATRGILLVKKAVSFECVLLAGTRGPREQA